MIAPTGRAIAFIAIGAPLAVLLGLLRPDLWVAAAVWVALGIALVAFDAMLGARVGQARLAFTAPGAVGVGDPFEIAVRLVTGCSGVPRAAALSLDVDSRLAPLGRIDAPLVALDGDIGATIPLSAQRRGMAAVAAAWIGWTGPIGFARKQRRIAIDRDIAVVPSIRAVREEGAKLFAQIGRAHV